MQSTMYRIRVDLAAKLKERAKRNKRSATKELEALLEAVLQG